MRRRLFSGTWSWAVNDELIWNAWSISRNSESRYDMALSKCLLSMASATAWV